MKLGVPAGTLLACEKDSDCPPEWRCSTTIGSCVAGPANQAPSVTIASIPRTTGTVPLKVTLFDEESNEATLSVQLRMAGIDVPLPLPDTTFATAPGGVEHTLALDLGPALGEGYRPDLALLVTSRDKTGVGATVASEPFAIGNDPPKIEELEVTGSGGIVMVSLRLTDSSDDPVRVSAFEYSRDDFQTVVSVPLDDGNFGNAATLAGLPTSVRSTAPPLAWHTATSAALPNGDIAVRLKVEDAFGAESEYAKSATFLLDNSPKLRFALLPTATRAMNAISFTLEASDPNAPGDETLSLALDYATAAAPNDWHVMTLDDGTDVANLAPGPRTIVWNALAQPMNALSKESIDTTNGAGAPVEVLGYESDIRVRAQLTDSAGLTSEVVYVSTGAVGNKAPTGAIVGVSSDPKYDIAISVSIEDAASDPADLEVQFAEPSDCGATGPTGCTGLLPPVGDCAFRDAALVLSNVNDLATSPAGATHLVMWNSAADPAPGSPRTPQGVGYNLSKNTRVRVRAIDHSAGVPHYGPWSTPTRLCEIRNQNAARVDNVEFDRLIDSDGSGPVTIRYKVYDDESHPVDVSFELSFDGGPFGPCPEYPTPLSEDTRALRSSPIGVEHVFVWNPTADRIRAAGSVELKIKARDSKYTQSESTPIERFFPRPAQPSFDPPNDGQYTLDSLGPTGPSDYNYVYEDQASMITTAADLTGDGITDVLATQRYGTTVEMYIGQGTAGIGNGTFLRSPQHWYCANPSGDCGNPLVTATTMGLYDLGGDGLLDVLMAADDARLWYLKGTGNDGLTRNSFIEPAEEFSLAPLTDPIGGFVVANLNGDSYPDLAVATLTGAVAVFVGAAAPGPIPSYNLTFLTQIQVAARASKVVVSRVDADADLDLIVAGDDIAPITVLLNDLSGPSPALIPHVVPVLPGNDPFALAVLDIDADGTPDLAAARERELLTLTGQTTPPYFVMRDTLHGPQAQGSLNAVDVNADGFDDLIATETVIASTTNGVECYFGRGINLAPAVPFFTSPYRAYDAAVAYLNSDDVPDVAFARRDPYVIGPNLFVSALRSSQRPAATNSYFADERAFELEHDVYSLGQARLRTGDFNGDGVPDLAYAGPSPLGPTGFIGEIRVRLGAGSQGLATGGFQSDVVSFAGGAVVSQLEADDLNDDGLTDLVLVRGTELIVALSSGAASFAASSTITLPTAVNSLRLADVSNDGVLDILATRSSTTGILLYLGNQTGGRGDGTFASLSTIATGAARSTATVVGDFNGDNLTDIIFRQTAVFGVPPSALLLGTGNGLFAAPTTLSGAQLRVYPTAIDLNRDGYLDLVSSGGTTNGQITVSLGQGVSGVPNGTFAPEVAYPGHPQVSTPGAVFVTDADLDGTLDLVAFTLNKREIMLLRGQSANGLPTGTFAAPSVFLTSSGLAPSSLVVRDLNGDEIPDWAILHAESRVLSLWYGQYQEQRPFAFAVRQTGTSKVRAFGSGIVEPDVGLFGTNLGTKSVIMRPAFPEAQSRDQDFWNALRRSGLALPSGLDEISNAWLVDGFEKAHRMSGPSDPPTLGARLRLFNRFGPLLSPGAGVLAGFDRGGLDLNAGRGLVVSLPLNRRKSHATLVGALAASKVHVFKQVRRLYRSDEIAADPLDDPRFLPRLTNADGQAFDLIRYETTWHEVPADDDGSFSTGSSTGERFIVKIDPLAATQPTTDAAKGSVEVLLDEPGTLQAFVVP
ncbi:MAG: VCBS repeat-containing protein [Deltaproteobacteria bacterium]|nr:VCBS repeat-containing protein [Deltaproteobacteria bacterium]